MKTLEEKESAIRACYRGRYDYDTNTYEIEDEQPEFVRCDVHPDHRCYIEVTEGEESFIVDYDGDGDTSIICEDCHKRWLSEKREPVATVPCVECGKLLKPVDIYETDDKRPLCYGCCDVELKILDELDRMNEFIERIKESKKYYKAS